MYKSIKDEAFHIHTYRCKHAGDETDEAYVKKALELGVKRITFTDHAPFPGNPFGNRMAYEELPEYITSLTSLKHRYVNEIEIVIGLEIEYFPSFEDYYHELRERPELEVLMLGQHMFEVNPGSYSFSYKDLWFPRVAYSVISGIKTGYFDGIAHPDRIFKKEDAWTEEMQEISETIILEAGKRKMFLEQNQAPKKEKNHYWQQFWDTAEKMKTDKNLEFEIIKGLDAHSTKDIMIIDS